MKKPSDFMQYPWGSIFQKSEAETVVRNIMVILNRLGNKWRKLSWEEYKEERIRDGNFTEFEKPYFNQVIDYTTSEEKALLVWK